MSLKPVSQSSGAPPAPATPSAPAPSDAGSYVVQKHDTLWKIAQQQYGDPRLWTLIRDANPRAVTMKGNDVALIKPGARLVIPPKPAGTANKGWAAAGPRARPKVQAPATQPGPAAPKPAGPTPQQKQVADAAKTALGNSPQYAKLDPAAQAAVKKLIDDNATHPEAIPNVAQLANSWGLERMSPAVRQQALAALAKNPSSQGYESDLEQLGQTKDFQALTPDVQGQLLGAVAKFADDPKGRANLLQKAFGRPDADQQIADAMKRLNQKEDDAKNHGTFGSKVASFMTGGAYGEAAQSRDELITSVNRLYQRMQQKGYLTDSDRHTLVQSVNGAFSSINDVSGIRKDILDTTTTAGEGVVLAVATVATAGMAAPAAVAVLAGTGAATRVGLDASFEGQDYTLKEGLKDAALGGIDGAAAGIAPAAGKLATRLAKPTGAVVKGLVEGAGAGAAYGGTSSAGHAALDEKTWKDGVGQGLKNVAGQTVKGAGTGAAFGGLLGGAVSGVAARVGARPRAPGAAEPVPETPAVKVAPAAAPATPASVSTLSKTEAAALLDRAEKTPGFFRTQPAESGRLQLSASLLEKEGAAPKYSVKVGDATYHLSDRLDLGQGRQVVMGFVETADGKMSPQAFYRSNSQAAWRRIDSTVTDQHYGKGLHEFDTQVPIDLGPALNELPTGATATITGQQLLDGVALDSSEAVHQGGRHWSPEHQQLMEPGMQPFAKVERQLECVDGHVVADPTSVSLPEEKMPDFSKPPDYTYQVQNAKYGKLTGDPNLTGMVYTSKDGQMRWLLMKDAQGRVAPVQIEYTDAAVNKLGLKGRYPDHAGVEAPLMEYGVQIPPKYGGSTSAYDTGYRSNWQYLKQMPVVQRFYAAQGLDINAVGVTAP